MLCIEAVGARQNHDPVSSSGFVINSGTTGGGSERSDKTTVLNERLA